MYKLRVRAASENIRTYASTFGTYVAGKVGAGGQEYTKGLISGTLSSVCQGYFSGVAPPTLVPTVVDGCVSSIYTNNTSLSAEAKFVSVFGASMFCNYVVGQAYPIADQFSTEACQGLQDLVVSSPVPSSASLTQSSLHPTESPSLPLTEVSSVPSTTEVSSVPSTVISSIEPTETSTESCSDSLLTDENNCGKCGNKGSLASIRHRYPSPETNHLQCPQGQMCVNGDCMLPNCDNYGSACGPGNGCECLAVDNWGLCGNTSAVNDLTTEHCDEDNPPGCPHGSICHPGVGLRCVNFAECS